MYFRRFTALAAVAAAAQLPCGALAQNGSNLLANGGFDAGLTGYAPFASPGYIVMSVSGCNLGVTCALFGTPGTGPGFATLSQTVPTVPGTRYLASITTGQKASGAAFSFFLEAGEERATFECLGSPRCVVSQALTAMGTSTTVTFGVEGFTPLGGDRFGQSGIVVDNASLIAISAVPEPAAWATLCAGLLCLGTASRRRAAARRL